VKSRASPGSAHAGRRTWADTAARGRNRSPWRVLNRATPWAWIASAHLIGLAPARSGSSRSVHPARQAGTPEVAMILVLVMILAALIALFIAVTVAW
jgi:hypothetical protein